ncbi:MAG TPA: hypothetical protein VL172_08675 [Kofleriaceae bacterium]|jgi:hypothetical protein|nr:hypothetical protein [Kofleriaceae bacterium]
MNLIPLDESEAAVVDAFRRSPEYTAARLPFRPVWAAALLDCMTALEWSWADLDLLRLRGLIVDGLSWTIAEPPRRPTDVARELHALLRWAARTRGHRHADACCRWLRTHAALTDIDRWVRPRRGSATPSPCPPCPPTSKARSCA